MVVEPSMPIPSPATGTRGRVRMRTLVLIRWIAVCGQLLTLLVVNEFFGFEFPFWPALMVVAALILFNLSATLRSPGRAWLTDREAALYLAFDILQLSLLLFLTGGLRNPFALLILIPLTIGATILSRRSTIALTALTVMCVSVLSRWSLPLPWSGHEFAIPTLYVAAVWIGLVLSATLLAAYSWTISEAARRMSDALSATQVALAREQQRSALGILAAAAAHELGSPLGTIAVVTKEIARDLPKESPLAEDIGLLLSQSERCREILAGLAQRPEEAGTPLNDRVPVVALVETAAASTGDESIEVSLASGPMRGIGREPMPMVPYRPEIVNGLRSLIQNAVQFARTEVAITTSWDSRDVAVTIRDDGPGFSTSILQLLGEPYISSRAENGEHMGLGVFIAQTLLEQTGAMLSFGNRRQGGAEVIVSWGREELEVAGDDQRRARR